jgi:hypothetical protein
MPKDQAIELALIENNLPTCEVIVLQASRAAW